MSARAERRDAEARARDSVRVSVARKGVLNAFEKLELLQQAELGRLETRVVLVDVRHDLNVAAWHLRTAAMALQRIERSLKERTG